ncbi:MAG: 30S ribosomal protein S9 [Desulfobacterales bacterium]|nr:30S ribosomal protein S9 [Desulfobacterales bacterium]
MPSKESFYATGRRKTSIARTWLTSGKGDITINDQPADQYFKLENARTILQQPLDLTNTIDSYDINVRVTGGGTSGQAGAIRHGIARALVLANADFRQPLKKAGFIKRDPRVKERKKYGQRGARARFQFSKR